MSNSHDPGKSSSDNKGAYIVRKASLWEYKKVAQLAADGYYDTVCLFLFMNTLCFIYISDLACMMLKLCVLRIQRKQG